MLCTFSGFCMVDCSADISFFCHIFFNSDLFFLDILFRAT